MDPENLLKEGYLYKKGDKGPVKAWKKRWFSLSAQSQLLYSKEREKSVINIIYLDKDSVVATSPSDDKRFAGCCFQLSKKGQQRIYFLRADSEQERDDWIALLQSLIKQRVASSTSSLPVATAVARPASTNNGAIAASPPRTLPSSSSAGALPNATQSNINSNTAPRQQIYAQLPDLDPVRNHQRLPTTSELATTSTALLHQPITAAGTHGRDTDESNYAEFTFDTELPPADTNTTTKQQRVYDTVMMDEAPARQPPTAPSKGKPSPQYSNAQAPPPASGGYGRTANTPSQPIEKSTPIVSDDTKKKKKRALDRDDYGDLTPYFDSNDTPTTETRALSTSGTVANQKSHKDPEYGALPDLG